MPDPRFPRLAAVLALAGLAGAQQLTRPGPQPDKTFGGEPLPGSLPGTERWIAHFESRPFDLSALRAAHETGDADAVAAVAADLDRRTRAHQRDFVADVEGLGGRAYRQFWLVNACAIEIAPRHLATIRRHPNVDFLQPDAAMIPVGTMPIKVATDSSHHDADRLQAAGHTGNGIGIAIIDTGHDENMGGTTRPHVTYSRRGTTGSRLRINRKLGTLGPDDPVGHGTAVASVAAGWKWRTPTADQGHAFDADIAGYSIALNAQGGSSATVIATAYQTLVAGDAARFKVKVSNLSFSGSPNPLSIEQKAADSAALTIDLLVCTAAGNSGADLSSAGINLNGLSVGATAANTKAVTGFSCRGLVNGNMKYPDMVANGEKIRMALRDDESLDSIQDGTSFAAPQVAGAATQLRARFPALKSDAVKAIMLASTLASPGTGSTQVETGPGCGYLFNPKAHAIAANGKGHGRVDVQPRTSVRLNAVLQAGRRYQMALAWHRQDVNSSRVSNLDLRVLRKGRTVVESRERLSTVELVRFTAKDSGVHEIRILGIDVVGTRQPAAWAADFDVVPSRSGTYTAFGQGCKGTGNAPPVTLPGGYASKFGESNAHQPFGTRNTRYQQVFFKPHLPATARLAGLSLRQPFLTAARPGGKQDIKIILAHTARRFSSLSNRFADNPIAGTQVTVFDGVVDIPTFTTRNSNPGIFGFELKFTTPFSYDSAKGSLLMEVVNTSSSNVRQPFDYSNDASALTSRVVAGNATANSGNRKTNFGLVVRFEIDSGGLVPEISAAGPPAIGETARIRLSKAKALSSAVLWLGARRIDVPLPPALAPGCRLLASFDLMPLATASTDFAGDAAASLPIPADLSLLGGQFHNQWAVRDAVNPLGFVFSNGGTGVIGL